MSSVHCHWRKNVLRPSWSTYERRLPRYIRLTGKKSGLSLHAGAIVNRANSSLDIPETAEITDSYAESVHFFVRQVFHFFVRLHTIVYVSSVTLSVKVYVSCQRRRVRVLLQSRGTITSATLPLVYYRNRHRHHVHLESYYLI